MRKHGFVKGTGMLICGLALVGLTVGTASADDKTLLELKARLDALEQQNKELQQKVQNSGPYHPVYQEGIPKTEKDKNKETINKQVDKYLKEKDEKKKAEEAAKVAQKEADGYVVGPDLSLKTRWNYQQGLLFETANNDIRAHMGFFFQNDYNSFTQSPRTKPFSQLGNFQDGAFFRRIRPLWNGNAYDTFEWNIILALEQLSNISSLNGGVNPTPAGTTNNTGNGNGNINLDEMWAGLYNLPIIGRIRIGHLKVNQGLEGNQWSSSRAMTFQENTAYTDAFYTIFGTGVQICNSALEDRVTWQGMFYRDDFTNNNSGVNFGDGNYCATGRMTALLVDEDEDRTLVHVGLSGTWRKAMRADQTGLQTEGGESGPTLTRLRARPELRDAIGGSGDGFSTGDSGRMVDTGNISAQSTGVVGTELLAILGPFSATAEYAVCYLNNAKTGTGRNFRNQTRSFNGGYITLSYFLTGETRQYDKTFGRFGTFYIDRPFTNFWSKRRDDGSVTWGWGAWEVAARYSYVNLNDGPIQGGEMGGTTIGLNWYLSSNMKLQFEYLDDNRYHKGTGVPPNVTGGGGNLPGVVQGFGTRFQMQF